MGRLTLNVLLSFAQFEREATGERIRDEIAASKRKGTWMGGRVPLGYEVCERRLVINQAEAAVVRQIYQCYLELGSVRLLKPELDQRRMPVRCKGPQERAARHSRVSRRMKADSPIRTSHDMRNEGKSRCVSRVGRRCGRPCPRKTILLCPRRI